MRVDLRNGNHHVYLYIKGIRTCIQVTGVNETGEVKYLLLSIGMGSRVLKRRELHDVRELSYLVKEFKREYHFLMDCECEVLVLSEVPRVVNHL